MGAKTYRELQCWQLANELKRGVYELIATEPAKLDVRFCNQLRDSARGGPRTIAEGFGRYRAAEFARYLEFARASLIETQNHLDDALDCRYINSTAHQDLVALANRAIGAVTNLHRYLRNSGRR
jgi:four helix bundle protein